jgi:hypothetical protein
MRWACGGSWADAGAVTAPAGHPAFDVFLVDQFPAISCVQTLLNRLLHVDVMLNVFQRCVFGQFVE